MNNISNWFSWLKLVIVFYIFNASIRMYKTTCLLCSFYFSQSQLSYFLLSLNSHNKKVSFSFMRSCSAISVNSLTVCHVSWIMVVFSVTNSIPLPWLICSLRGRILPFWDDSSGSKWVRIGGNRITTIPVSLIALDMEFVFRDPVIVKWVHWFIIFYIMGRMK